MKMNRIPEFQNTKEWYLSSFRKFEEKLNGESKSFLHDLRKEALAQLAEVDFPTTRDEEWKYTSVSPILKQNFIPAFNIDKQNISKEEIKKYFFSGFDFYTMTFINGIYSEELSDLQNLQKGVTVNSLSKLLRSNPKVISEQITKFVKTENAFNLLNRVYSTDGAVVIVPDGVIVEKPIQILFLNGHNDKLVLSIPHNLIVAGKNSQVSIITNYSALNSSVYFSNIITEVFAGESSIVDLYKIQNENDNSFHYEKVEAHQLKKSIFNHYNFTFGGEIVRNDINSTLDDENIETHYYGLYLGKGNQHIDNHTFVDHAKPNCMSNELYKGILDNEARGVFNGKIIVRKDAQKTNAYQQNKTVLLSKTAKINTKPQLEIFADDVKCTHGATVGHLDDTAYYYIRTRGIPAELAKSMLIRAFANDVVESVKIEPLRDQLNHMIFEHLHRVEIEND
ncbi:MAG: Fe-S cluster assembly protein SufD [Melioribacteraceae bacterium]|nr:Fe-S cluster assembly protein SufD [Melioribacteraceae bacterium]